MPTLAEIEPVATTLRSLLTAEPVSHGALTMIPLVTPLGSDPDWLTLDEAGDQVRIAEVSEGGSVPDLTLTSAAAKLVLVLDGEELIGAKQNRVLNTTVLVAAGATLRIPVSCVEQGRWHDRSRHLAPSDTSLYASLRGKKAAWVTRSVRAGRGHRSDQVGLWTDLAAKDADHEVASPTGAMRDFYSRYEDEMAAGRRALSARPGQVGALVYLAGRWAGLDLLAGPRLFARAWERLATGYLADGIGRAPGSRLAPSPRTVLRRLAGCPAEAAPAVGLGHEYRLIGPDASGAVLVLDDLVAHLMAFPDGEAGGGGATV
jgi:hypothetical protein